MGSFISSVAWKINEIAHLVNEEAGMGNGVLLHCVTGSQHRHMSKNVNIFRGIDV